MESGYGYALSMVIFEGKKRKDSGKWNVKSKPLLVAPPALLILGFVVKGGVSIKQRCCSLVPAYGWTIWFHQHNTTPTISSESTGTRKHTQTQREKGKGCFQMTIHPRLSGYRNKFSKAAFHFHFSSLASWLSGVLLHISIWLQIYCMSVNVFKLMMH